jgi:hypothetical protein
MSPATQNWQTVNARATTTSPGNGRGHIIERDLICKKERLSARFLQLERCTLVNVQLTAKRKEPPFVPCRRPLRFGSNRSPLWAE